MSSKQHEHTPFFESHTFADLAIGTAQGAAFSICGQPFDAVRLNSQTGNLGATLNGNCHTTAVAKHIYKAEGLRGFVQGWTFPAFGFTLGRAFQSLTMNTVRDYFILEQRGEMEKVYERQLQAIQAAEAERERNLPWWASSVRALGSEKLMEVAGVERRDPAAVLAAADDFGSRLQNDMELATWKNMLAASAGAVAYTTCHTPFDMVRVRMLTANQYSHRLYHSSLHCAWTLFECGGIRKLYLGYNAALIRDIPAQNIVFGLYGILRPLVPRDAEGKVRAQYGVLLGGFAGCVQWASWGIVADSIKTRIQTAPEDMHHKLNWRDAARRIFILQGYRGFYVGLPPALMKAFVGNAALFAATEFSAPRVENWQRGLKAERTPQHHQQQQQHDVVAGSSRNDKDTSEF